MGTDLVGELKTLQAEFALLGVPTNPTDVSLVIEKPDGSQVTVPKAAMTNPVVGTFEYIVSLDQAGWWRYRFTGAGTVDAVEEAMFAVVSSTLGVSPGRRPCEPWTTTVSCPAALVGVDEGVIHRAVLVATELVWALSGRRFGSCRAVVRPCRRDKVCAAPGVVPWGTWPWVVSWPSAWSLVAGCRRCPGSCGCDALEELLLPRRPATAVTQVKIDGAVLDPAAYRLDDWRRLVRVDGGSWPTCQDLALDDDQPGTFSIALRYGVAPPESGKWAVERLACEVAKAMVESDECELPQRVQTVTRQGITVGFIDPQEFLDKGHTGITEVDYFLRAYNPHGLSRRARVYRADTLPAFRRTGG